MPRITNNASSARQPSPPTTEFIRSGSVPLNAPHIVRYVDEDAAGEPRLIEVQPLYPALVA